MYLGLASSWGIIGFGRVKIACSDIHNQRLGPQGNAVQTHSSHSLGHLVERKLALMVLQDCGENPIFLMKVNSWLNPTLPTGQQVKKSRELSFSLGLLRWAHGEPNVEKSLSLYKKTSSLRLSKSLDEKLLSETHDHW